MFSASTLKTSCSDVAFAKSSYPIGVKLAETFLSKPLTRSYMSPSNWFIFSFIILKLLVLLSKPTSPLAP